MTAPARIAPLKREEKRAARRQLKARNVEQRMIRLRQSVQCQHPQHRRQSGAQNRQLKGDDDKRRPAIERPPGDIDRIAHHIGVPLHEKSAHRADDSADQHDQRQARVMKTQR